MLVEEYPPDFPICKRMLYFNMIRGIETVEDEEFLIDYDGTNETSFGCYWMMYDHIFVDILEYNSGQLDYPPIYQVVTAEDLEWVCIYEEYVDSCVDLFWDHFVDLGLSVYEGVQDSIREEESIHDPRLRRVEEEIIDVSGKREDVGGEPMESPEPTRYHHTLPTVMSKEDEEKNGRDAVPRQKPNGTTGMIEEKPSSSNERYVKQSSPERKKTTFLGGVFGGGSRENSKTK